MPSDGRAAGGRVVFVDLLRLVASFQMVQGHTLDAVLAEAHRSGPVFDAWTWTRGLTSVAFLFAAGVSFHLATLVRLDRHLAAPGAPRRRFERGLLLVALGYLMHAPFVALGAESGVAAAALRGMWIVDVLQCIGVTLIVLEALTLWLRDRTRLLWAVSLLGVGAVALAPLAGSLRPEGVLAPVLHYLSPRAGSIFPLLPWSGYMLLGVAAGAAVAPDGGASSRPAAAARLCGLGAAALLLGWGLGHAGTAAPQSAGIVKLGAVLLLTALLAGLAMAVRRLPRVLETLAGETLVLYVSHVVVLYAGGIGLAHVVGRTVPLPQAIAAAIFAVLATAAVGIAWNRVKALRAARRALLAGRPQTG